MSLPTTFEGWVFWSIVALVLLFDPVLWVAGLVLQRCCRHKWTEGFGDPYGDTWYRWRRCIRCQRQERQSACITDPSTWTFRDTAREVGR